MTPIGQVDPERMLRAHHADDQRAESRTVIGVFDDIVDRFRQNDADIPRKHRGGRPGQRRADRIDEIGGHTIQRRQALMVQNRAVSLGRAQGPDPQCRES